MIDPTDPIVSGNVPEIGKKVDSIPVVDVMTAMAQLEQELKEFFLLEAATMQDRIDAVYALHKSININGEDKCEECSDELYPCCTIEILNGEQNDNTN